MDNFEINLKEASLETLTSLMNNCNYFLLELNEHLQYYKRGMEIYIEQIPLKEKHIELLENNLSGENLESYIFLKNLNEDNLQLATTTVKNLYDLLVQQTNFVQSVMDEIKSRM